MTFVVWCLLGRKRTSRLRGCLYNGFTRVTRLVGLWMNGSETLSLLSAAGEMEPMIYLLFSRHYSKGHGGNCPQTAFSPLPTNLYDKFLLTSFATNVPHNVKNEGSLQTKKICSHCFVSHSQNGSAARDYGNSWVYCMLTSNYKLPPTKILGAASPLSLAIAYVPDFLVP